MAGRVFSLRCPLRPRTWPVLTFLRMPKPETASLSSNSSDTFPSPASLVAEIRSGGRLTYSAAGRLANQERQRIEHSEVIPWGQVPAARQVGGEKQTKQVSETAKRAAMRPEGGYVDLMR